MPTIFITQEGPQLTRAWDRSLSQCRRPSSLTAAHALGIETLSQCRRSSSPRGGPQLTRARERLHHSGGADSRLRSKSSQCRRSSSLSRAALTRAWDRSLSQCRRSSSLRGARISLALSESFPMPTIFITQEGPIIQEGQHLTRAIEVFSNAGDCHHSAGEPHLTCAWEKSLPNARRSEARSHFRLESNLFHAEFVVRNLPWPMEGTASFVE